MRIDVVTLFPDMIRDALSHSMMARAQASAALEVVPVNPRDFTEDKHRTVDDTAYGGGPGMVMMAPPIERALHSIGLDPDSREDTPVILLDPVGQVFRQRDARRLSALPRIALVCGHYEGMDDRVRIQLCTDSYSIGDFVLTGGELPALCLIDSVARLLPGVLGDPESHLDDSHENGLLGHPLFTKPATFRGEPVPQELMNGNHREIERYRRRESLQRTRHLRPDLFVGAKLTEEDVDLLG